MGTKRIYQIAGSQLVIDVGSVLDLPAEVVVSSDDYQLTMSGGVSAAIRTASAPHRLSPTQIASTMIQEARNKYPLPLTQRTHGSAADRAYLPLGEILPVRPASGSRED
jgi:hypothetical protein